MRAADLFWRCDTHSYAANAQNEDRSQLVQDHVVLATQDTATSLLFCGCYDGHGGEEAVEFVEQTLYANIKQGLQTYTSVELAILEVWMRIVLCVSALFVVSGKL